MRAAAKTRKRVRFGAVTYVSPPPLEDTPAADVHRRCGGNGGADVTGRDAEFFLGTGESDGFGATQRATLLLCSAPPPSSEVRPVIVDVEDDEERSRPVTASPAPPALSCAPSSPPQPPCLADEVPSDEATYDTPLECAASAERRGGDVPLPPPRQEVAESSGASPIPRGSSPTLSQLLAAVDDVLGSGSQRASRSPVPRVLGANGDGRASRSSTPPPPQSQVQESPSAPTCSPNEATPREAAPDAPCRSLPPPAPADESAAVSGDGAQAATPVKANAAACVFCGAGDDGTASAHPAPPLCVTGGVTHHMSCALWCPEVYYDVERGALQGVEAAAARAQGIKCALCRRPGAAAGCACTTCPLSFHVPCAVRAHASVDVDAFLLYCPAHRCQREGPR